MSSQKIIELEGVTKRYGRRVALNNVSLAIEPGVSGLLGPNGSGKSTMIKSLLGLLKLQTGRASVMGYELPSQVFQIRDSVGYLPEDDCFIAGLSGIESVRFMAELSGIPGIEALRRGHEAMDFADIGQERYRKVETYSTGMRQKLKFAQAIVHDPQLIILDEPTSGLDPEQRTSMLRKIQNLALHHGKSIVISTHILHDVRTVCDHVVIMSRGEIQLVDSLENLSRPTTGGIFVQIERQRSPTPEDPFPDASRLAGLLRDRRIEASVTEKGVVWVPSDATQEVWRSAAEAEILIQQMSQAKNSLEEIFFRTVKEAEDAAA